MNVRGTSLRSDGFSMAVVKDGWEVIKQDLLKALAKFFDSGVVNASTNYIYLSYPKKGGKFIVK